MSSSRTIAKNTIFLYIRMLLTMGVSLYTSRVVLNTLGMEDYGVYVIVGGVVTLFGFFNSAMSSATQRFLSFDIGRNDDVKLKQTFNATLNIHIGIAILILTLAETIGLWFVNYKLKVPIEKMNTINWIYQFSIFTFLIGVIQVPYNALIIARERMNIYAIFSSVEVSLKLLTLYILIMSPFPKLNTYAVLIFAVSFLVASFYKFYCKSNFKESSYEFYYDKKLYRTLLSYSGWNLFGNVAAVTRSQGINVLLNLFFGTLVNAAYGITIQVQSAVNVFVTNFQMAVNPQIIKNYSNGNAKVSLKLILQSAKISYFLMFIIAAPILLNTDFVLNLWLKNPPNYTHSFVILALINVLIDCISGPLMIGAQASGNIKWYQISIGSFILLCLPISYFLLHLYEDPEIVYYVIIAVNFISLFARLFFLKYLIGFDIKLFLSRVLLKIFMVTSLVLGVYFFTNLPFFKPTTIFEFLYNVSIVVFLNILTMFFIGLNKSERNFIISFIQKKSNGGKNVA